MKIASPGWLVLGVLVAVALAVGAVVASRRRAAALAAAGLDFSRASMGVGGRRTPWGLWVSIAGILVLAFAVSGPAAALPVSRAAGTVIVAMDVSNSMGATDVAPTRLDAAKKAAAAFVTAQPDSVDVGVVAFENGGLTTDRPSADHAAAVTAIDRLKVTGGTSLADAILVSLSAITGRTVTIGADGKLPSLGYWRSATIVLFSDGQDEGSSDALEAAATLAENSGVHIETVGVGTAAGTTVDVGGYRVETALDASTLQAVAETTGGSYHPASDVAQLDGIASTINLRLTTHNEDVPLAGAFVAFAVVLLAFGSILTVLRTGRVV